MADFCAVCGSTNDDIVGIKSNINTNVYLLTKSDRIISPGDDLNDYSSPGVYAIPNKVGVLNLPSSSVGSGILIVQAMSEYQYFTQTYKVSYTNEQFVRARYFANGGWHLLGWQKIKLEDIT